MAKKKTINLGNIANSEPQKGWNTLHIFGYGETQLNGEIEKKVSTSTLTKAKAVIDYMYSLKPADSDAGEEFHAITFVKDIFGRYVPKNINEKTFSIEFKDLDFKVVQDLITELESLP